MLSTTGLLVEMLSAGLPFLAVAVGREKLVESEPVLELFAGTAYRGRGGCGASDRRLGTDRGESSSSELDTRRRGGREVCELLVIGEKLPGGPRPFVVGVAGVKLFGMLKFAQLYAVSYILR